MRGGERGACKQIAPAEIGQAPTCQAAQSSVLRRSWALRRRAEVVLPRREGSSNAASEPETDVTPAVAAAASPTELAMMLEDSTLAMEDMGELASRLLEDAWPTACAMGGNAESSESPRARGCLGDEEAASWERAGGIRRRLSGFPPRRDPSDREPEERLSSRLLGPVALEILFPESRRCAAGTAWAAWLSPPSRGPTRLTRSPGAEPRAARACTAFLFAMAAKRRRVEAVGLSWTRSDAAGRTRSRCQRRWRSAQLSGRPTGQVSPTAGKWRRPGDARCLVGSLHAASSPRRGNNRDTPPPAGWPGAQTASSGP